MRVIDADAYIAEMHNRQEAAEDWIKSSTGANQIRAKATFLAYCEAALTLKNMPTIDAVPVVRCRECAAYRSMKKNGGLCKNTGFWVPENGFCHDGERKDGAGDG